MRNFKSGDTFVQPGGEDLQPTVPGVQPEPLMELSDEEAAEWRKFTKRMPGDWFPPETWPMLAQCCRHIVTARWLGECLQEMRSGVAPNDDDGMDRVEKLIKLHDREGRAFTQLMVRLRL